MLSSNHLQHVCLLLQLSSKTCRYLAEDDNFVGVYHCQKWTSERQKIDDRIKNIIKTHQNRGTDPYETDIAMGDNCPGYVAGFRHLEQGYDKD